MKFEKALPLMRKGTYMTRSTDKRRIRLRIAELDGDHCFVARVGEMGQAQIIQITTAEVLAEDWEEYDVVIQRDQEEAHKAAQGGAQ